MWSKVWKFFGSFEISGSHSTSSSWMMIDDGLTVRRLLNVTLEHRLVQHELALQVVNDAHSLLPYQNYSFWSDVQQQRDSIIYFIKTMNSQQINEEAISVVMEENEDVSSVWTQCSHLSLLCCRSRAQLLYPFFWYCNLLGCLERVQHQKQPERCD